MGRRSAVRMRVFFATSRSRRNSTSTFRMASPTRMATPSIAGARISWSMARALFPPTAHCSRATSIIRTSMPSPPQVYQQRTRPTPGIEFLSSRHFPEEFQGNLLVPNVIGFQGILRYKIDEKDASLAGTELEPMLSSRDPNFRPSDIEVGPGRRDLLPRLAEPDHRPHAAQPARPQPRPDPRPGLPDHPRRPAAFEAAEDRGRIRSSNCSTCSKIPKTAFATGPGSSSGRATARQVVAALKKWVAELDKSDPDYEHHLTEALWAHQYQDVVNPELLDRVLASTDHHARAAATRVLCVLARSNSRGTRHAQEAGRRSLSAGAARGRAGRELLPGSRGCRSSLDLGRPSDRRLSRLYPRRDDEDPGAVLAKSDCRGQADPRDQRCRQSIFPGRLGIDELLKIESNAAIDLELLLRKGVREEIRRRGSCRPGEARQANPSCGRCLTPSGTLEIRAGEEADAVAFDLGRLLTGRPAAELTAARPGSKPGDFRRPAGDKATRFSRLDRSRWRRRPGLVAGIEVGWLARDLVAAMPAIRDPGQRAALYPEVLPLLDGLPESLGGGTKRRRESRGDSFGSSSKAGGR